MTTILLNGPPTGPDAARGEPSLSRLTASGMFEVQLTRTGAMMGTPAYMAPEQFLGTATDARTDQFSFCVALYEALYGERPFSGNTMFALTTAVVQGQVKEAAAELEGPALGAQGVAARLEGRGRRALSLDARSDRRAGQESNAARRRLLAVAAVALVPVALTVGVQQSLANHKSICGAGPARLAGIWDLTAAGELEPARQAAIHSAFLRTGKSYASEVYATVNRILSGYAQSWGEHVPRGVRGDERAGEQSAEVLDLRMSCLQERLGGLRALTDVFSDANGQVVEPPSSAANNLGRSIAAPMSPLLRSVVRPPEDPATRARVAELRHQLAGIKALYDSGRYREGLQGSPRLLDEVRALGYQPLIAETLEAIGMMYCKSNDVPSAEKALVDSYLAADASRDDEVRAEDATNLVWVVGYQEGRYADAQRWAKYADAILQRLGGHVLLQAWLLNNLGGLFEIRGEKEAALRMQQEGLALKERALGRDHPDVGISEGNLAVVLTLLGRNQEALEHVDRSIEILENGLGAGSSRSRPPSSTTGARSSTPWAARAMPARRSRRRASSGSVSSASTIATSPTPSPGLASATSQRETLRTRSFRSSAPSRSARLRRRILRAAPRRASRLARALWESGRDRPRARTLAEEAHESYAKAEIKTKVAEVDSWLHLHGAR